MTTDLGNARPDRAVVQGLWIGDRLSTMERLSILSFLAHGHPYELYAYQELEGVPPGARVRDAAEILPRDQLFTYRNGSWAAASNLFRFELLARRGGIWADTDMVLLAPLPFTGGLVLFEEPSGDYSEIELSSCLLSAPVGHPAFEWAAETCRRAKADVLSGKITWNLGPSTVERLVERFGLEDSVLPWQTLFTCSYLDWRSLIDPGAPGVSGGTSTYRPPTRLEDVPAETLAIHCYHQMWRSEGLDKDGAYPPGSIYETLKRRHGLAGQPEPEAGLALAGATGYAR